MIERGTIKGPSNGATRSSSLTQNDEVRSRDSVWFVLSACFPFSSCARRDA